MHKQRHCQAAGDHEWKLAQLRKAVIRPLAEGVPVTHGEVDAAARQLGVSRSFTYKLMARYKRRPQTSSLLPGKRGRALHTHFLSQRLEALMRTTIDEFYLQRERPRLSDLMAEIHQRCQQENLKAPHFRTVRRRLLAIDGRIVMQRRLGIKAADAQYRPVQESSLRFCCEV